MSTEVTFAAEELKTGLSQYVTLFTWAKAEVASKLQDSGLLLTDLCNTNEEGVLSYAVMMVGYTNEVLRRWTSEADELKQDGLVTELITYYCGINVSDRPQVCLIRDFQQAVNEVFSNQDTNLDKTLAYRKLLWEAGSQLVITTLRNYADPMLARIRDFVNTNGDALNRIEGATDSIEMFKTCVLWVSRRNFEEGENGTFERIICPSAFVGERAVCDGKKVNPYVMTAEERGTKKNDSEEDEVTMKSESDESQVGEQGYP